MEDLACLQELQEVFQDFDVVDDYYVMLRHKHFDLEPGETLLTTRQDRTLTTSPMQLDELTLGPGQVLTVTEVDLARPLNEETFPPSPEGANTRIHQTRVGETPTLGTLAIGSEPVPELRDDIARPITSADFELFHKIQATLRRNGAEGRFSIMERPLILGPDERLFESRGGDRTLIRKPVSKDEIVLGEEQQITISGIMLDQQLDEETFPGAPEDIRCVWCTAESRSRHGC